MTDSNDHHDQTTRRAASAKFELQNQSDSTADLQDAMETAPDRSLASLQLSFRALQVVMVVLVVTLSAVWITNR